MCEPLTSSEPPPIVVVEVYVLTPLSVHVPASSFWTLSALVPLEMLPLIVPTAAPRSLRPRPPATSPETFPATVRLPALAARTVSPPPEVSTMLPLIVLSPASFRTVPRAAPEALLVCSVMPAGSVMAPPLPSRRSLQSPAVPFVSSTDFVPAPNAVLVVMTSSPALTVTDPVKVLLPDNVWEPVPALYRATVPRVFLRMPLNVPEPLPSPTRSVVGLLPEWPLSTIPPPVSAST